MHALPLERACLRAWPPAKRLDRFGWVHQASSGCSWRVNAVWPLEWTGELPLRDAIEAAATWQQQNGARVAFKIAEGACAPDELPDTLSVLGYWPTMESLVMTRRLSEPMDAPPNVEVSDAPDARFWNPVRESAPSAEDFAERRAVVERIKAPCAFARIESEGKDAAIGLGVRTDDLLGLYLMRTAPWARRRGLARALVRALCKRGASQGATQAYLQVEAGNAPACALYESEGFTLAYRYHYWIKQT